MKRVFAVAAHPDDIEFMMAGTMILLGRAGYELHYMTIANGSCGTSQMDREQIIAVRRQESINAARRIGAVYHEALVDDLEIYYEPALLAQLASVIRDVAPSVVLTHSPEDYMEDHTNACRLAVTATFCRGMRNFVVDPPRRPVGQQVTVYHAQPHGNRTPLGEVVQPHLFVDTTGVIDDKAAMLAEHKSQKHWLDESQGQDSYLETMRQLQRETGRMSSRFEYAEGWRRHMHFGFCDADTDPLIEDLPQAEIHIPER